MSYPVTLGGLTFDIPSLPWRKVIEIQPLLLSWVAKNNFDDGLAFSKITKEDLEELASYIRKAIQNSPQGQGIELTAFEDLPITMKEMIAAITPILRACGLEFGASQEGNTDPKAETGTSS